ncbi:hypothetical protein [Streptococcus infantis]|mgnify:CR=1 FL=1|jgi:hypothetical protein|uniref:hypothetical protein n=1 Tax=Streptococcus TaxID=1301 RepID=UPI001CC0244F|nr:hypothetical protein [Streptococcus infantis]MBZ2120170.1 hypothetical protein [Streptococcus infantis]MBZ2122081.1 hypothetical protein [Streptococcus infantis]MBZ2125922.1 hypothetical protein [Streptococcus infantis]
MKGIISKMIFEIHKSCLQLLAEEDPDVCSMLNSLATNRRKGLNVIIADRDVLDYLKNCTLLEVNARRLFGDLRRKSPETEGLKKVVSRYYTIVANNSIECDNCHIITVSDILKNEFLSKTQLIVEDSTDFDFYHYIGLYFASRNRISYNLSFDIVPGGGQNSATILDGLIKQENRLLLGIFDGDQKYPGDTIGGTLKAVLKIIDSKDRKFFECISLAEQGVHEVENLIPLKLIEEIYDSREINAQHTIKFLNRLYEKESNLYFYFDMKKGIYLGNKTYTDNYDACWKDCVESFKVSENLESLHISKVIISQCGLLEKAIEYLSKKSLENGEDLIFIFENFVKNTFIDSKWTELGKEIFTWGCVGRRIP